MNNNKVTDEDLVGVRCFMLDFFGLDEGQPTLEDAATPESIEEFAASIGGGLRASLKAWLELVAPPITDSGGGVGGWHLGCHCTPSEAWMLYKAFKEKWRKACQAGLLSCEMKSWSRKVV